MGKSIKLMHVMAGNAQGGAEGFCLRLILALQARGVQQALVTRPDMARLDELRAAGVIVRTARFATPLFDFKTHKIIKKTFTEFSPNIVMAWMNRGAAFADRLKRGNAKLVGRLGGYYNLKYYRKCDYLIGNTEDLVSYFIRENWPAERAAYLPNFAEHQTTAPARRADFNTPPNAPLFFALGRFHPNKAFDVLLDATAQVPNAYLWLAGEGELRSALETQANNLGIANRVRFLGWHINPAPFYAAADYFICPSRHEPLGNVMLEAMAHGKPIIATDTQGARQLLQDNVTAHIVSIDNTDALANAMREFITNPDAAQKMATAAQSHYNQHYSADIICQRYLDFLYRITEQK